MAERKHEPETVSTTVTGNHPSGNYLNEASERDAIAENVDATVWIEWDDQGKQGMARKGDPQHAQAAPDHPHMARRPRSGGRQ